MSKWLACNTLTQPLGKCVYHQGVHSENHQPLPVKERAELHLANNHPALCIFDNFKGQLADEVLQLLEDSFIDVVFVPPNSTDQL